MGSELVVIMDFVVDCSKILPWRYRVDFEKKYNYTI